MNISEYRFFSLIHDDDMVRVSAWNKHGDEYFALVRDGRGYSDRREEAVQMLALAIEDGRPAGEYFPFATEPAITQRPARRVTRTGELR